jgi:signal transduction histidine kinase
MNTEKILVALESHLRESQPLDAVYYANTNPTSADRAAYHQRQLRADALRYLYDAATNQQTELEFQESEIIEIAVADSLASGNTTIRPLCRMSHDLKNLLHIVVGYSEVLADFKLDPDAAKCLDHIRTAAAKAAQIAKMTVCRIAELSQSESKLTN